MSKRWKLFLGLSILLVVTGSGATAQETDLPDHIILWSPQGPVAVERPGEVSASDLGPPGAERLLQELLKGPSLQEERKGLWTAIPRGTALLGVLDHMGDTLIVRLDVPSQALQSLDHESFEIMVDQIADTLIGFDWHDLRIQVQDPESGAFVALAEFLPPITVPHKSSTPSTEGVPIGPTRSGQPPAPGQAQPPGALSGKTVYVSAGHGWQWNSYVRRWRTQRPPYPNPPYDREPIIEDHNNAEAVNQYLLHYLWNAGAMVWPVRERDMNGAEAIVDNDSPETGTQYDETGPWTTGDPEMGYADAGYRQTLTVAGQATATATWRASLPSDDQYAVYVWYRPGADRPPDAQYTVYHAGGATTVEVDQRVHGNTWHYIGTYGFLAGEEAQVTLTNLSSIADRTVVADAVRFGGGTFDDLAGIETGADMPPDKPWWEVASFYYTQRMGMEAAYGDVTARPIYARWEHAGTGDDAVYVSWHTNGATGYQWSYSGTETYVHNDEGLPRTEGSVDLRHAIHTEVVHDIRTGWDGSWVDRGGKQRNLGELRLLWASDSSRRMPGALIEIGFHDHPDDTDALKEPTFNLLVARALYQGIVKYFDPNGTLLPEPPTHLAVENVGGGALVVSWQPSPTDAQGLRGDLATGYRVYASTNGIGWSDGIPVTSGTDVVLDGFSAGQLLFVRVTATNAGGESFPTETLAVRVGDRAAMLLVNGFDRLNRTMIVQEDDPVEGSNARMLLDRMNRYDYAIQHGEAIGCATDFAFDAASNEAVQSGRPDLSDYAMVDWILGEESVQEETLSASERALLRGFLAGGGALFISGSEIGYHLDLGGIGADPAFYADVLRAEYAGDDGDSYCVSPASGSIFSGSGGFRFDADGMYDPDFPDVLTPIKGSSAALVYQGGTGGTAAVQYANGCERVVVFGFPFETIQPDRRSAVMSAVLGFLDECAHPAVDTSISSPSYGSAYSTLPIFAGTAQPASVSRVEVQIQDSATGQYWNGSHWVTSATWLEATGDEAWSYALPPSLPEADYRLRARAQISPGNYDESPAETAFTYDTTPPASTSLIAPTGGATISALPELTLDWSDVAPDAGSELSYLVDLDGVRHPTSSSFYTTSVSEGTHTWGVQVVDAASNESEWVNDTFIVDREHARLPLVQKGPSGGVPACHDLIVNGGFESDGGWLFNGHAAYVTTHFHSPHRSAQVGHDKAAYSSVRQEIVLPEGSSATLRLWLYPISEGNDPDDLHYVWLRDQWWDSHPLELTTSDAREWRQGEYDLTPYMGQRVTIFVGALNDSDGDAASIFVDDVELEFCP
jgi:hypothetical protein